MNFRRLGNDTVWGSRSTVEGKVSEVIGESSFFMAGFLSSHQEIDEHYIHPQQHCSGR